MTQNEAKPHKIQPTPHKGDDQDTAGKIIDQYKIMMLKVKRTYVKRTFSWRINSWERNVSKFSATNNREWKRQGAADEGKTFNYYNIISMLENLLILGYWGLEKQEDNGEKERFDWN